MDAIPFVDLKRQYQDLRDELTPAIERILSDAAFVGGPEVARFEAAFAAWCGAAHCVGVANGTDALHLVFRGLGIGPGDEVIVPASTFIATAEGVSLAGATPVFVDVEPGTQLIDPDKVEAAITEHTKAIVGVHLYGQPADMTALRAIADRHQVRLVEDAAQAHGATVDGHRIGSLGDAAAFSFYPGKNLGAYGDGGAVVTHDREVADRIRQLANHGRAEKQLHAVEGMNSRLDGLQAAILNVKMAHIDDWNAARRRAADTYDRLLADVPGVQRPVRKPGREHVFHLYVVEVPDRDGLMAHLADRKIASGIHYAYPLHLQPAYAGMGHGEGSFPVAEAACAHILSLPMYPELTDEAITRVAEAVADFAKAQGW